MDVVPEMTTMFADRFSSQASPSRASIVAPRRMGLAPSKTATIRPPVRLTTNNIVALREATLGSLGLSMMPRWFVDGDLRKGTPVEALPDWRAPKLGINLAYARSGHQTRRLRAFIDVLVSAVPELLSRRAGCFGEPSVDA